MNNSVGISNLRMFLSNTVIVVDRNAAKVVFCTLYYSHWQGRRVENQKSTIYNNNNSISIFLLPLFMRCSHEIL